MPSSSPSILILDHAEASRLQLAEGLAANGFDVHLAASAEELRVSLKRAHIQLVLLDVDIPDGSGLLICRQLAERDDLRIIALCASHDEADAVIALEMGADDCVAKSAGRREILARVRARLRRSSDRVSAARRAVYRFGEFLFDCVQRRLETAGGATIPLTPCQASLLAALLQAGQQAVTRHELLAFVRGEGIDVLERAVDSHISRLRARMADFGGVKMISTIHRRGYQWTGGPVTLQLSDEPAFARQLAPWSEQPAESRTWASNDAGGSAALEPGKLLSALEAARDSELLEGRAVRTAST
jgi:DNA-binding response OmpR family regulator